MRAKWGQNFLVDQNWQKKIVGLFEPPGDFGEIGPGKGAITQHLKKKYSSFSLFEIDPEMVKLHDNEPEAYPVLHQSFLDWDFCLNSKPVENFSLIGNLPYESATAMMVRIAEHSRQISHFVFLIQREVAERVTAKLKTKSFGSLSVLMQLSFDVRASSVIPPGAFRPAPKVDSQIIVGFRRDMAQPTSEEFNSFVKRSFLFKRKRLQFALKKEFPLESIRRAYDKFSWSEDKRAEEVSPEEWLNLYRELKHG